MLYCPNYSCQTPNPETHKFCQKCRTPLPKHYLWAIGERVAAQPGELVQNRFLCKARGVFLDTKPGLVPETAIEVPAVFTGYLRLSPYQLHIPQVYEVLDAQTVMLDEAALFVAPNAEVQVLPSLSEIWPQASALRQLNLLWQIASLWQPLASEQTATSLLLGELLRVEGGIVRLLELIPPQDEMPTLAELGQQWAMWTPAADPAIADFLDRLCRQLIQGEIHSAEQLVDLLDQALVKISAGQQRQIHIATRTDQGPTRQRNEDACFPASGTVKTLTISANQTAADPALAIVCDGIGGHQGGNVASNLAIATLGKQLQGIHAEQLNPAELTASLEAAVWAANDEISQRNDSEQRLDRQRMGTTLVMGLVRGHELYTTHVGDSRAYRITRWGCRQVTQDDDIASREVRLGYSVYREALQHPGSGSLIQALGMGASHSLHPTVQRFALDEDCVFLFCSDGLSDNDRVQEIWDTEILPLLDGSNLGTVCDRLVELANTRNGHDNVTVALMSVQVIDRGQVPTLTAPTVEPVAATVPVAPRASVADVVLAAVPAASDSTLKTQVLKPPAAKPSLLPLLLSILILLGIGGVIAALIFPSLGRWIASTGNNPPPASPIESPSATPTPAAPPLEIGSFLTIASTADPLRLLPQPKAIASPDAARSLPVGTRLQVVSRQSDTNQERWVQVRVCSLPDAPAAATDATAIAKLNFKLGDTGWLEESVAAPFVVRSLSAAEQGACSSAAPTSPPPLPTTTPPVPSPTPSP